MHDANTSIDMEVIQFHIDQLHMSAVRLTKQGEKTFTKCVAFSNSPLPCPKGSLTRCAAPRRAETIWSPQTLATHPLTLIANAFRERGVKSDWALRGVRRVGALRGTERRPPGIFSLTVFPHCLSAARPSAARPSVARPRPTAGLTAGRPVFNASSRARRVGPNHDQSSTYVTCTCATSITRCNFNVFRSSTWCPIKHACHTVIRKHGTCGFLRRANDTFPQFS